MVVVVVVVVMMMMMMTMMIAHHVYRMRHIACVCRRAFERAKRNKWAGVP